MNTNKLAYLIWAKIAEQPGNTITSLSQVVIQDVIDKYLREQAKT